MKHHKPALRAQLLQQRRAIAPAQRAQWDAKIAARLAEILQDFSTHLILAGYAPIKGEADIMPVLHGWQARGGYTALPAINEENTMQFRIWNREDILIESAFSTLQPSDKNKEIQPDIILVPLIGFDRTGSRLGFGKGYYDRALAQWRALKPELLAIGVGYAMQEMEQLPHEAHDERLDVVVTEKEIIHVKENE